MGTSAVVSRALRLIAAGALDSGNVEDLADRVGLGARHLRRLFVLHLGASPVRIAITRRVHFAQNLIADTDLPITDLAACAGFRSLRQFNHAIRSITGESPSQLRRQRGLPAPSRKPDLLIRLPYRPPFHWTALLDFLTSRAIEGVELIQNGIYRRTVEIDGVTGIISVEHDEAQKQLIANLELSRYDPLMIVVERVRRMFDLTADPLQIAEHLSQDPRLGPLVSSGPGLRVPGVWDGFEATVRAILGEGLTNRPGKPALVRFARAYGKPIQQPARGLTHMFPLPRDVAQANLESADIPSRPADAIRAVAAAILTGNLTFQAGPNLEEVVDRFQSIRGVGSQAAQYIAMRAFGEPDAFPSVSHELGEPTETWRPWRAYAAMHLWHSARSSYQLRV